MNSVGTVLHSGIPMGFCPAAPNGKFLQKLIFGKIKRVGLPLVLSKQYVLQSLNRTVNESSLNVQKGLHLAVLRHTDFGMSPFLPGHKHGH